METKIKNDNTLIADHANLAGCRINWLGRGAVLEVGKNFNASGLEMNIYSNAYIKIGCNVEIYRCKWDFYEEATCIIEDAVSWGLSYDNVFWGGSEMYVRERGSVRIGHGTHLNKNGVLIIYGDSTLSIGSGSLFGRNVTIRTGDGHSIYDIDTREQINITSGNVEIGEHVWLCEHVKVLANSTIGEGSIIGANSVIKGNVPKTCIFAGVAGNGRVIRENVEWER